MSDYRITELDGNASRDPRLDPMEIAGAVIAMLVGVVVLAGTASNLLSRPQEIAATATSAPVRDPAPSAVLPMRTVSVIASSRRDVRVVPWECRPDVFVPGQHEYEGVFADESETWISWDLIAARADSSPQPGYRVVACYEAPTQP